MSDLIRREDVIATLCFCEETKMMLCKDLRKILERIDGIPSAEPERKKGKWISHPIMNEQCSECGHYFPVGDYIGRPFTINFCPNCGADMRGDR